MGFLKKRVVLKNSNDLNKGLAVLTIEQSGSGNHGEVKVYNLQQEGDLLLGISNNGKEELNTKIMLDKNNTYSFRLSNSFDINSNIACVIVKKQENAVLPLLWGSNDGFAQYREDVVNMMQNKWTAQNEVAFESVKVYETQPKENGQMKLAEKFESSDEEIEQLIDEELGDFYSLIKEQIDELFRRYPNHEKLTELIPNSEWVRVDYEGNGHEYVVGIIKSENKVKYICYGVPSMYNDAFPDNLEEFSQWLPLDETKPEAEGFYLMFQDAETGDSVNLTQNVG